MSFVFASGSYDGHEKKQGVLPLKGITAKGYHHLYSFYQSGGGHRFYIVY